MREEDALVGALPIDALGDGFAARVGRGDWLGANDEGLALSAEAVDDAYLVTGRGAMC